MKKLLYISIFITAAGLTGCNKFLDKYPLDSVNTENYWLTENDAINAINGAYQPLQWPKLYNMRIWTTDIWANNSIVGAGGGTDGIETVDIANFVTTTDNAAALDIWRGPAPGILRANLVIENVPGMNINAEIKNRVVGEAKFLRGLYYFLLVQLFGDVPLITIGQTPDDDLRPNRTPKNEVYNQIITDLKDAAQLLPDRSQYAARDIGRASKGAAMGLLAKVYLTLGNYPEVITLCEDINALQYQLNTDYSDNFSIATENSIESLFEVQYIGKTNFGFWDNENQASWLSTFMGPRNGSFVAGSYGWNQPTDEFVSSYEAGDLRKGKTILYTGGPSFDGQPYQASYSTTGYNVRKFLVAKSESPEYDTNPLNFPVLRFADVLLMWAEALNESGRTADAQAIATTINNGGPLNRVRLRAGLNNIQGLDQATLRQRIRNERRIELAFEGHRWFDLIRYDNGAYALDYFHSIGKTNATAKHLLLPIPQREREANPNLRQNNGY